MMCPSCKETFQSTSIVHPPPLVVAQLFQGIVIKQRWDNEGGSKHVGGIQHEINKIHLFRSQIGKILLKGFYENQKGLIFKDHISILINY
jgi:hypothetical protein